MQEKASRLGELMNSAVRDCLVENHQPLIAALELPDPADMAGRLFRKPRR